MHPADLKRLLSKVHENRGKEPVDVEKSMRLLDRAHAKAQKQKEDYAKFLSWKVVMQRKERERREEEEAQHQLSVEERLKDILIAHRRQRREEQRKWTDYIKEPIPVEYSVEYKPQGPIVEIERLAREREQAKKKAREKITKARQGGPRKTARQGSTSNGESAAAVDPGVAATVQRLKEKIGPTELAALGGAAMGLQPEGEEGGDPGRWHEEEVARRLKLHEESIKQLVVRKSLCAMASKRRLYSMNKLLEDPPADYLIGGDVLRYVASDAIAHQPMGNPDAPEAASSRFFITAMGEDGAGQPPMEDDTMPEAAAPHQPRRPRRRTFDPLTLRISRVCPKLPPLGSRREAGGSSAPGFRRDKDHEAAIGVWYEQHVMPYTRIRNRADGRGPAYTWNRTARHQLPTLPSELYVGQTM